MSDQLPLALDAPAERVEAELRTAFYAAGDTFINAVESGAPMEERERLASESMALRKEYMARFGVLVDDRCRHCGTDWQHEAGNVKCHECGGWYR